MTTIRHVFASNLKRLRGDRTQKEIAKLAKIPLRTYQRAESGLFPKTKSLASIAKALNATEIELFSDPDTDKAQGSFTSMFESFIPILRFVDQVPRPLFRRLRALNWGVSEIIDAIEAVVSRLEREYPKPDKPSGKQHKQS